MIFEELGMSSSK